MFNKFLMATAIAGGMLAASSASAASISFAIDNDWTTGSLTFSNGTESVSVSAANIDALGNVTANSAASIASHRWTGLGVCNGVASLASCTNDLSDIDGSGENEIALFDFGPLIVNLTAIHFGNVDDDDDFSVLNFGGDAGSAPAAFHANRSLVDGDGDGFAWSKNFSVGQGSIFGIGSLDDMDDFMVKRILFDVVGTRDLQSRQSAVAAVPLPAGGLLLLGGLGGLTMLRRRKKG